MPLHTNLESWGLNWRAHKWTSPWPRGKRVSPRTLECQNGRASLPATSLPTLLPGWSQASSLDDWSFWVGRDLKVPYPRFCKLCSPGTENIHAQLFKYSLWTYYLPGIGLGATSRAALRGKEEQGDKLDFSSSLFNHVLPYIRIAVKICRKEKLKFLFKMMSILTFPFERQQSPKRWSDSPKVQLPLLTSHHVWSETLPIITPCSMLPWASIPIF